MSLRRTESKSSILASHGWWSVFLNLEISRLSEDNHFSNALFYIDVDNLFTDGDIQVMVSCTQAGNLVTSGPSEQASKVKKHGDA